MTIPNSSPRPSSSRNRSPHTILYPNRQIPTRIPLIRRISFRPLKTLIRERATLFNLRFQSLPLAPKELPTQFLPRTSKCVV